MATADGCQCAVRPRQPRTAGMPEQKRLSAETQHVGPAVVGTSLRQARAVPIKEILGAESQFGVEGQRR
ncbi:hypothetical protein D3C76_1000850 [compost metagenome]